MHFIRIEKGLNYMNRRHPYKIGDIIKLRNGPYCEFLGYSDKYTYATHDVFLVQYIKSYRGVPIACRTRHHLSEYNFKDFGYCEKTRKWKTGTDWLPVIKKKDNE